MALFAAGAASLPGARACASGAMSGDEAPKYRMLEDDDADGGRPWSDETKEQGDPRARGRLDHGAEGHAHPRLPEADLRRLLPLRSRLPRTATGRARSRTTRAGRSSRDQPGHGGPRHGLARASSTSSSSSFVARPLWFVVLPEVGGLSEHPTPLSSAYRRLRIPDAERYWVEQVKCRVGCPVFTDACGYVTAVAEGRDEDAYAIARATNPFVSICGRICGAPCERACRRGSVDAPVSIRAIKRWACELHGNETGSDEHVPPARRRADAAPEGRLPREGRGDRRRASPASPSPTTSRARATRSRSSRRAPCPAGMLTLGVPLYRLPRELVKARDRRDPLPGRRAAAQRAGRAPRAARSRTCGARASRPSSSARASRAAAGSRSPGADLPGVVNGLEFLKLVEPRRADRDRPPGARHRRRQRRVRRRPHGAPQRGRGGRGRRGLPRHRRRGPDRGAPPRASPRSTSPASSRSRRCRPTASRSRRASTRGCASTPRSARGPSSGTGRSRGIEFVKCLSVFDSERRFNPQFDETRPRDDRRATPSSSRSARGPTSTFLRPEDGIELTSRGLVKVDPETLQTSRPDVFAGGDVVLGPRLFIDAIASGQVAAREHPRLPAAHHDQPSCCAPPGRPRRTRWAQDWEVARAGAASLPGAPTADELPTAADRLVEENYPEAEARAPGRALPALRRADVLRGREVHRLQRLRGRLPRRLPAPRRPLAGRRRTRAS